MSEEIEMEFNVFNRESRLKNKLLLELHGPSNLRWCRRIRYRDFPSADKMISGYSSDERRGTHSMVSFPRFLRSRRGIPAPMNVALPDVIFDRG